MSLKSVIKRSIPWVMGGLVLATVSSCSGVLPQQNSGTPATPPNEALPDAPTTTAAGSEAVVPSASSSFDASLVILQSPQLIKQAALNLEVEDIHESLKILTQILARYQGDLRYCQIWCMARN
jgi:hypothetical protein